MKLFLVILFMIFSLEVYGSDCVSCDGGSSKADKPTESMSAEGGEMDCDTTSDHTGSSACMNCNTIYTKVASTPIDGDEAAER